jgi:hypothetical protein
MPVTLDINKAKDRAAVLSAIQTECAGPTGHPRTFSDANFTFNPPDDAWVKMVGRQFNIRTITLITKFKEKRTSTRETFDVFFTYTDPTDSQKKERLVGAITEN